MTPSPTRARRGQVQPVLAVALGVIAIAGIVGAVLVSRPSASAGPGASDRPSTPPSSGPVATPVATPVASPSAAPTAKPSVAPSAGIGSIDLENATGHDVVLQVHDQTDTLTGAVSGKPGDGMSVRWHDAIVKNAGARTIVVTWAGLPQDDTLDLGVAVVDGKLQVTIVQAGPVPNSDAMGEDRIVALTFDGPVSADDVTVLVLDRTVD
jgi:hypothetical protein